MDGVAATADGARGSVIDHLKSFLQFLRLNRNLSPHTVRAYGSDLDAVSRGRGLPDGCRAPRPRAGGARPGDDPRFPRRRPRARPVAGNGGAQACRRPHLPALPAPRRRHRRRSRRADRHAEARSAHAGTPVRAGDDRVARGAGRRPAARAPGPRDSGAVLRVGIAAERARRPGSRRCEPEREDGTRAREGRKAAAGPVQHEHRIRDPSVSGRQGGADAGKRSRRDRTPQTEGSPRTNRCSSTTAAGGSPFAASTGSCGAMSRRAARGSASARTPCGIPSPRICCSAAPTCGRSRNCSAMRASAPRSATRMSTPRSCSRCTGRVIRGREGQEGQESRERQEGRDRQEGQER